MACFLLYVAQIRYTPGVLSNSINLHKIVKQILLPALALILPGLAFADTLAQPNLLSSSKTYTGSGSGGATDPTFFTANMEPFDSSLGALVSFTITMDAQGTVDGTVGTDSADGYANAFFGGTFLIDNEPFFGGGSPEGSASGASGSAVSASYTLPTTSRTFNLSDDNDPAIIASVTGSQPFKFEAKNGVSSFAQMEYSNMATVNFAVQSTITVTYNYLPAAAAHSSALKVTQISHNPAAGSATLGWSSQSGKTYSVDASPNLTDWQVLQYGIPATAPANTLTESSLPPDATQRFYRVRSRD
jgi:hypothetical protein